MECIRKVCAMSRRHDDTSVRLYGQSTDSGEGTSMSNCNGEARTVVMINSERLPSSHSARSPVLQRERSLYNIQRAFPVQCTSPNMSSIGEKYEKDESEDIEGVPYVSTSAAAFIRSDVAVNWMPERVSSKEVDV